MNRLAVISVLAFAACGPKLDPNAPSADDAIVKLTSNVRDAQVYVDGRFIAPLVALRGGIAITPGVHRVELRHDEYFSSYLELTVTRAQRTTVALQMAPLLP